MLIQAYRPHAIRRSVSRRLHGDAIARAVPATPACSRMRRSFLPSVVIICGRGIEFHSLIEPRSMTASCEHCLKVDVREKCRLSIVLAYPALSGAVR